MAYPNLKQSVWLIVLFYLILTGLVILIAIIGAILDQPLHTIPYVVWGLPPASFVLLVYYVLRRTNRTWSGWPDLVPIKKFSWALLLPLVVSIPGLFIISVELGKGVSVIPFQNVFRELVGEEISSYFAFYAAVTQAPIVEEGLFRGIILGGLLAYRSKHQAAIWSAILFAIFHLNPWQFPVALILGLVFAWWFIQTGSLLPCILGQALNNFLAFILARSEIQGFGSTTEVVFLSWWVDVCAVLLAAMGLWWFYRLAKRGETKAFAAGVEPVR